MEYRTMLHLQKCLYFNTYLFMVWVMVVSFFLYVKFNLLGHLSKYLSITSFILLIFIESARIYLGKYGNLSCRVPELAGFLMLTLLMQMPLVSFFLFNPYLLSTPAEIILHALLWLLAITESIYGYMALKGASSIAKEIYFSQPRDRFEETAYCITIGPANIISFYVATGTLGNTIFVGCVTYHDMLNTKEHYNTTETKHLSNRDKEMQI